MKRTILSSLLFLYPINCAFHAHDQWMLNLCALAMAASLVNHSHTFHGDRYRRTLFGWIDEKVMMGMVGYVVTNCLLSSPTWECVTWVGGVCTFVATTYFGLLRGLSKDGRPIEEYTEWQRNVHFLLLHVVGIVGMTTCYNHFVYTLEG